VERFAAVAPLTLERLGRAPEVREQRALLAWPEMVGPRVAARTEPQRLRGGLLTVSVDGAAWLSELTYLKADLRGRLNARLGEEAVRDIRLVPGTVSPRAAATLTIAPPETPLDPADVAAAEAAAAVIADPELRAAVLELRLHALRRR
jgi:hypothetical protein